LRHAAGIGVTDVTFRIIRRRSVQPHLEQNQSSQSVADAAGVPYRTEQRWLAQYQLFGLVALVRKRRGDRGARRVVSAELKAVIEGLALQKPPLPLAALFRQVQRLSKDLGEKAPNYGTVVLYTDNGSDFTSNHLEQVGADLKIRLVFSIPGNRGAVAASSGSSQP